MNDCDAVDCHQTLTAWPKASATPSPQIAEGSGRSDNALPPTPASSDRWVSIVTGKEARRPGVRRWLSIRHRSIIAAALMCAVIGLSAGCGASPSATSAPPGPGSGATGGGSNARSGPASGGASGVVAGVSTSSFILTTAASQQVTVDEGTSTTYQNGTRSTSASAVGTGESVLVLGTTSGTTITAAQIFVQPTAGGGGSAASSAAGVIPFQSGVSAPSRQVGQVPANYTEGSGTIVGGTIANQATVAALASYPGGVVDRVVQLSDDEYEVHYIGVAWPHHIFVSQEFKVVGAD